MLIKVPGVKNTIMIFTKETCEKLKALEPEERRKSLAGALTAYYQGKHPAQLAAPAMLIAQAAGVDQELVQKVMLAMMAKGMTGPSDAPDLMNRNQPVTAGVMYTAVVDPLQSFGFETLFDLVDMRNSGQTSFDLIDVTNAITFAEKKSGERMKVYGITSTKSAVSKMTVAAAIGILDDWINYAQFWNLNQAAVESQSKYYQKMATDHYALLAAISVGQNQAFDTSDVKTINNACGQIFADLKNKGYVLTGNEVFELRANPLLKQRIEYAFTTNFNSPNGGKEQIVFNINRMYTNELANTSYYVGLPGRKAKRGVWADLSAETDRDILLKGTDVAYSGEYNAAIGEEDQFRRCSLS